MTSAEIPLTQLVWYMYMMYNYYISAKSDIWTSMTDIVLEGYIASVTDALHMSLNTV